MLGRDKPTDDDEGSFSCDKLFHTLYLFSGVELKADHWAVKEVAKGIDQVHGGRGAHSKIGVPLIFIDSLSQMQGGSGCDEGCRRGVVDGVGFVLFSGMGHLNCGHIRESYAI